MLEASLNQFCAQLDRAGGALAFYWDGEILRSSHPDFGDMAKELEEHPDFDQHQAVFIACGPETGQLHTVALHRTLRGPGAGGVRRLPFA